MTSEGPEFAQVFAGNTHSSTYLRSSCCVMLRVPMKWKAVFHFMLQIKKVNSDLNTNVVHQHLSQAHWVLINQTTIF